MVKLRLLVAFLLLSLAGSAQIPVNNPIDPGDTILNDAVNFINKYFNEFRPGKLPDFTKYWSAEDCKAYKFPDQLLFALNTEIPTYLLGKPTILYARPENDLTHIKTMFSRMDSSGNVLVISITNHYINRTKEGNLYFVNPMFLVADAWESVKVRSISYFYPSYHRFNKKKAAHLAHNIAKLEKEWQLQPIAIRYYFADTKEEIDHFRGFDFTLAMGNKDKPSGMSDGMDNIVYCGGWGENYFHEVVHVYLNRLFPRSPLGEGLAVFYGGSLGHDLGWHLQRVNQYLQLHKEVNLNNLDDFYYIDNFTNPNSTILGMLVMAAYKKDGIEGIKRLMKYSSLDIALQKEYGVKKGEWDTFLRTKIEELGNASAPQK